MSSVLMITGEYPPARGGIADYTVILAENLSRSDVDLAILCDTQSLSRAAGWAVLPLVDRWDWGLLRLVPHLVRERAFDWVHLQYQVNMYRYRGYPAVYLLPWWLHRQGISCQVAVTCHDLNPPRLFPKAGRVRRWVVQFMVRHADAVLTADYADLETLHRFCGRKTSVIHVPVGCAIPYVPQRPGARQALRHRIGLTEDDFLIAHFGPGNSVTPLLEALSKLRDMDQPMHLILIGKTLAPPSTGTLPPDRVSLTALDHQLIAERDLGAYMHGTGYLPVTKVSMWLSAADAFASPLPAGFSFRHSSLTTAFAHGKAVITTCPQVAHPELIHEQNVLLVEPGNIEELADALWGVRCNSELRHKLERGALALAERLSWACIVSKHLQVYHGYG